MPVRENGDVFPITDETLERMPKKAARRLKVGRRPELQKEFREWVSDMGYEAQCASPMVRQLLFESFIGGWGAKIRQLKRKEKGT